MANKSSVVSWSAVPGAVDYEVVVVDVNGNANPPFNSPALNSYLTGGALSAIGVDVFGALPAADYRVQVRALAVNPVENGAYSAPLGVTYDPTLGVPGNVSIS